MICKLPSGMKCYGRGVAGSHGLVRRLVIVWWLAAMLDTLALRERGDRGDSVFMPSPPPPLSVEPGTHTAVSTYIQHSLKWI